MTFEEMVVALVATVGGLAFTGYVFAKITGLIKSWINRNNSEIHIENFNRLAQAFMKHKKESERRIQNLEAIIVDDEKEFVSPSKEGPKKVDAPKQSIEIEDTASEKEDIQVDKSSNLRNMLRE